MPAAQPFTPTPPRSACCPQRATPAGCSSRLGRLAVRGVIVTAVSATPEREFVSRFFAPAAGVPEDPVTGSAHCALAPYWGASYQASHRGGMVRVRLAGDRVQLGGQAVTVLRGELLQ